MSSEHWENGHRWPCRGFYSAAHNPGAGPIDCTCPKPTAPDESPRATLWEDEGAVPDQVLAYEHYDEDDEHMGRCYLEVDMLALKAAAHAAGVAQERERIVAAIRAIHYPVAALDLDRKREAEVCAGCGTDSGNWSIYPCRTVRALDAARVAGGEPS